MSVQKTQAKTHNNNNITLGRNREKNAVLGIISVMQVFLLWGAKLENERCCNKVRY